MWRKKEGRGIELKCAWACKWSGARSDAVEVERKPELSQKTDGIEESILSFIQGKVGR